MQCFVCVVVMHFGVDRRDSRLIGLGEPVAWQQEEGREIESNFIINTTTTPTIELQKRLIKLDIGPKRAARNEEFFPNDEERKGRRDEEEEE